MKWETVYLIVIALITTFSVYKVSDMNKKLRRLRKRYDLLLRGRGELNMEELLKAHSKDIDFSMRKLKFLEENYLEISSNYKSDQENINKKISNEVSSLDNKFGKRISNELTRFEKEIQGKNKDLFDEMNKNTNTIKNNMDLLSSKLNDSNKNFDNKFTKMYNNLDIKFTNEISDISKNMSVGHKKIEEQLEVDIRGIKETVLSNVEDMNALLQRETKTINDKVALSLQNVAIHKYNAFDNQTGDLSFSIVLLDRFLNGIILTSLNGRESSYTYAKPIKAGKSETELSPEEYKTLSMVIKQ